MRLHGDQPPHTKTLECFKVPSFFFVTTVNIGIVLIVGFLILSSIILAMERVQQLASERAVVVFSRSTCPMCHAIKALLRDLGVNPAVHEIDKMPPGREIEGALVRLGCQSTPAVFIGGELVGGANEVMSLHLNRSLIPRLRSAGALWV